jgi:hypothetical protein
VTLVGPLISTVGLLVPELWHMVQVEPLLPEVPETPFGYAWADDDRQITATNIRAVTQRWFNVFSGMIFSPERLGRGIPQLSALLARLLALPFELTRSTPNRTCEFVC